MMLSSRAWFFLSCFSLSALCIAYTTWKELHKRKSMKILTWNGKNVHQDEQYISNNYNGTAHSNHSTPKQEYIIGSLHYLSIGIYLFAFLTMIVGILRFFDYFCLKNGFSSILLFWILEMFTKCFIALYQYYRYFLCFMIDNNYTSWSKISFIIAICLNIFATILAGLVCILFTMVQILIVIYFVLM